MAEIIPFDQRQGQLWFDGKMINWTDAKVHVLTHGLHYASCVFEGERMYNGRIYKLEEHTARLFNLVRSKPLSPGIMTSRISRSNAMLFISARASCALGAAVTR